MDKLSPLQRRWVGWGAACLASGIAAGIAAAGIAAAGFFAARPKPPATPRPPQSVGDYNLVFPGAKVFFLDNGVGEGCQKTYTLKGRKSTVSVDFNNLLTFQGKADRNTARQEADEWRETQASTNDGSVTERHFGPFAAGNVTGYYQLAEYSLADGRTNEARSIFFVKGAMPYQVNFSFVKSDSASDRKMADDTWKSLLRQLGIPRAALPTGAVS